MVNKLSGVCNLPQSFGRMLEERADLRREARKLQKDLQRRWGSEKEKHRLYEALWLRERCAEEGISHLHTHFVGIGARTAYWLHQIGGPTFSVTAHANDIFRDEPEERLLQILLDAAVVVTVSDFSKSHLESLDAQLVGKVQRVYNGISLEDFSSASSPQAGEPTLISVGRLIPKKGFSDLIRACALLKDKSFRCQIVGDGPMQAELQSLIESEGLEGKVTLLGSLDQARIRTLLSEAQVFALPCVTASDGAIDNLPTVIMEAMAASLPVISTRLAGIPEMIVDGVTGKLVAEGQPHELASALRVLLEDSGQSAQMGKAGHQRCEELFDITKTSSQLLECLRNEVQIKPE